MHKSLEKNLPFLIEEFSSSGTPIDNRWRSILQRFFSDCTLTPTSIPISKCLINDQHNVLEVPSILLEHGYILNSSNSNTRFNNDDIDLANSLLKLTKQFITIEEAFEKGASEERQRIARDLHDDVAARMLTLIHSVKDEQTIALSRSILKSLRNSIYTLDNKSTASILDAITDVRSEIQVRLNSIGMQLIWHQSDNLQGLSFTPRQHINLNRMLHEITTNIIRHANAQFMEIIIKLDDQQISVEVSDNGQGFDLQNCIPGKGLNNIKTRAQELNGSASWFNLNDPKTGENRGSCVRINFLISDNTESPK
ncbi:MAG: histidine kinase [Gammaproteobacteria bacterium]|nr:histidine kinase [Gammaproteobacteria bacterium]